MSGENPVSGEDRTARRRFLWWTGGAFALVALVVLVVVASHRASSSGSPAVHGAGGAAAVGSGEVGQRVAGFTISSIDGARVRVPADRPGALFFSTADCDSCVPSSIALGKLKRRFGSAVDVLWVSIDPSAGPAVVRRFRRTVGDPPYPFAVDTSGSLVRTYRITALGTALVYDARGRVVFRADEPSLGALRAAFAKAGLS